MKIASLFSFAFSKGSRAYAVTRRNAESQAYTNEHLSVECGSTIDDSSSSEESSDFTYSPTLKKKKEHIEQFLRSVYPLVCIKSGVRIPLVVFSENDLGEGLFEYSFASEGDMVEYWKQVGDLKVSKKGAEKTRKRIIECCMDRNTGAVRAYISDDARVRLVEVYPTYATMISCMYEIAVYYTDLLDGDYEVYQKDKEEISIPSDLVESKSMMGIRSISSISISDVSSPVTKYDLTFQNPRQQVDTARVLTVDEARAVENAAGKLGGDESSVN